MKSLFQFAGRSSSRRIPGGRDGQQYHFFGIDMAESEAGVLLDNVSQQWDRSYRQLCP